MKSLKLLIFAALAIFFFACSSPAGSDANSTTVTNGTQNPTSAPTPTSNPNGNDNGNENQNGDGNENGGSSTTLAPNECDMGGDFNLEDWVDKIYVNGKLCESTTYDSTFIGISWAKTITINSKSVGVVLVFRKKSNILTAEKRADSEISQYNIQNVKKNGNRIDVTLVLTN